jgi:hypothetical protein
MATDRATWNKRERAARAIAGAVGLLLALIPIGFVLLAALAAGLSDNPDATGPGLAGFLFGCTVTVLLAAGVGALTLPWRMRREMRRKHWIGAGCSLAPAYVVAAIPTAFLASMLRLPPLGWVALFVILIAAYVYVWAGVMARWTADQRPASEAQAPPRTADKPSQE